MYLKFLFIRLLQKTMRGLLMGIFNNVCIIHLLNRVGVFLSAKLNMKAYSIDMEHILCYYLFPYQRNELLYGDI